MCYGETAYGEPIMTTRLQTKVPLPKVKLRETDGEPLESSWHRAEIGLLLEVLAWLFRDRDDYYAGGNMFIYFNEEQARTWSYRGPDFFYVSGVARLPDRRYWVVWKEGGRYPDLIIELLSPKTAKADRTTKKDLYEKTFRTPEYFCYDPDSQKLEGWRFGEGAHYQPIQPNEHGWLWSEELHLWLGTWKGEYLRIEATWLRFYDANGQLAPIRAEAAEAEIAQLKARLAEEEKKQPGQPQAHRRGRTGNSARHKPNRR
jgi:Uma2 family endonuclease